MTIKSFDKQNLKIIREDISNALKAVEQKHGMKLHLGNISFTSDEFSGKLKASIGDAADAVDNPEIKWRKEFLDYVALGFAHTIIKDDLDKEFSYGGKTYKIVGATHNRKLKIVLKNLKTNQYAKADVDMVLLALGRP